MARVAGKSQEPEKPEEAGNLDLDNLATKRETFAGNEEGILETEQGDGRIKAAEAIKKQQRVKNVEIVCRSSESLSAIWLGFILVVMLAASVHADIIESPENQVVLVNTIVIMKCKTNHATRPLVWSGNGMGSEPISIFDGEIINPAYKEFFSVKPDAGRYDLHIKAAPQLALKFKCIEPGADPVEESAKLIVIDSNPECGFSYPVHSEHSALACIITLSGNWIPTMSWRANGMQEKTNRSISETKRITGLYVEFTSTLNNVSYDDAEKYVCDMIFEQEMHNEKVTAKNVPSYKYTGAIVLAGLPKTTVASTVGLSKTTMASATNPACPPPIVWHPAFIISLVINFVIITGCIVLVIRRLIHKRKSSMANRNDHHMDENVRPVHALHVYQD